MHLPIHSCIDFQDRCTHEGIFRYVSPTLFCIQVLIFSFSQSQFGNIVLDIVSIMNNAAINLVEYDQTTNNSIDGSHGHNAEQMQTQVLALRTMTLHSRCRLSSSKISHTHMFNDIVTFWALLNLINLILKIMLFFLAPEAL